jgi:DNA (cytosine-5)-methyltransferase 1
MRPSIKVIDIFAGPGGLGEGFCSYTPDGTRGNGAPFEIAVSAEKDPAALKTLRLRAFFRKSGSALHAPDSYYEYLENPASRTPYTAKSESLWRSLDKEVLGVELGTPAGNALLDAALVQSLGQPSKRGDSPLVLIGGPPCQAYSIVGRARNKGIMSYDAAKDTRHYLYRQYLDILARYRPHIFVMENVKGILSSKIDGELIFAHILRDLQEPGKALGKQSGARYELFGLGVSNETQQPILRDEADSSRFVIRSEQFGIPQARHRVILFGIRKDVVPSRIPLLRVQPQVNLGDSWKGLPRLRSGISGSDDSRDEWLSLMNAHRHYLLSILRGRKHASVREILHATKFLHDRDRGSLSKAWSPPASTRHGDHPLHAWYTDRRLEVLLNHQSRSHMREDLQRYMFCSAHAAATGGVSPSSGTFPPQLAPRHKSWKSGVFADRFKVHSPKRPSGTVTSHISKDGHYYIHYDVAQCRSMSVREAARLQTFPDNYFFEGNRTQQYVQVGNAVPPLLARQIAEIAYQIISHPAARLR